MINFSSIKLDKLNHKCRFDHMPYEDYNYNDEYDDEEEDELLEEENVILACEDCDYRWKLEYDDMEEDDYISDEDTICPMCGSSNVVEI